MLVFATPPAPPGPIQWTAFVPFGPTVVLAVLSLPELLSKRSTKAMDVRCARGVYIAKISLATLLVATNALFLPAAWEDGPLSFAGALTQTLGTVLALVHQIAVQGVLLTSSSALLFFFLLSSIAPFFELSSGTSHGRLLLALHVVQIVLAVSRFSVELLGPEGWNSSPAGYILLPTESSDQTSLTEKPPCPMVRANVFSRTFFLWHSPMLKLGATRPLVSDDLWAVPPEYNQEGRAEQLASAWRKELSRHPDSPSLLRALLRAFGWEFAGVGVPLVFDVLFSVAQPFLLRLLLLFVTAYPGEAEASQGYIVALGIVAFAILGAISGTTYSYRVIVSQIYINGSITSLLYNKVLRLANDRGSEVGTILSRSSTDTMKTAALVNMPLAFFVVGQVSMSFVRLYTLLGVWVLPGVAVIILASPVTTLLAKFSSNETKKQAEAEDKRTRIMSDILASMRTVKLYAWEDALSSRLWAVRNDVELHHLRRRHLLISFAAGFNSLVPFLIAFASFGSFAFFSRRPLTPDIVFPALSLFQLLRGPVSVLTPLTRIGIDAKVSLKRLQDLLTARELRDDDIERLPQSESARDALVIENAFFSWAANGPPVLNGVNLSVQRGKFIAVVGVVGAGKSSLVSGILGNLTKVSGKVTVVGKVAYTDQHPWIGRGTFCENIIFGLPFEEAWFNTVIDACALRPDLEILPKGLESSRAPMSCSWMTPSRLSMLTLANTYLQRSSAPVACFATRHACCAQTRLVRALRRTRSFSFVTVPLLSGSDATALSELSKDVPNLALPEDAEKELDGELEPADVAKVEAPAAPAETDVRTGSLGKAVFATYLKWATPLGLGGLAVVITFEQVFSVATNVWLKRWAQQNTGASDGSDHLFFWLGIYFLLGMAESIQTFLVSVFAGCIVGCDEKMFRAVTRSPMRFFDTTPAGTIQNRFLGDIVSLELTLPSTVQTALQEFGSLIGALTVIAFSAPLVLLIILPLGFAYRSVQQHYLSTSRELNRLFASLRAPVLSSIQETAGGSSTIRAFRQQGEVLAHPLPQSTPDHPLAQRFLKTYFSALNKSQEAHFATNVTGRWLSVRLQSIGAVILLGAAFFSVFSVTHLGGMDSGQVGLMITYALTISGTLSTLVRYATQVETDFISVERVKTYSELESEAPAIVEDNRPSPDWPSGGEIEFKDVSARYSPDKGELVLKNVSFKIGAGESVGVVGRTGAGKSSLTMALFRIIEAEKGKILIDGVNIGSMGLKDLRSRLGIIPQEAQWFQGSLRTNLDPIHTATDDELWNVLDQAGMKSHVEAMDGGLEAPIEEGGRNLSAGQRQLLCLCRALLRHSKILVIDEATSSVDMESEKKVQATIRSAFKDCTLFIIAHRIETILHCDNILVMDAGRVAEFGPPKDLIANKASLFAALVEESGALKSPASGSDS